jgi:hypothetical protein
VADTKGIIESLAGCNINVRAVVSDMGAGNRAMWKIAGITANRDRVQSSIPHPSFPEQDLYFFADIPHLLKNIRNCMLANDILLPTEIVREFELKSKTVSIKHVHKLIEIQENSNFKLAPSLSKKHVEPKQYEKMKVNIAAQLLSHSTASALRYAVHDNLLPLDALTTAWFIELVNSWFDAANARRRCEALYAKSGPKIRALLMMMEIVPKLTFSGRQQSSWKPIQTGILVSTQSLLDLFASLVASGSYNYLLTSRLTQDALENLFSQIRGRGNSHPNPVHFRHCLRLITISQFLATPKRSSYDSSDCEFAVSLLKSTKVQPKELSVNINSAPNDLQMQHSAGPMTVATSHENNALCYITGWIAFKLKSQLKSCSACINFLVSGDPLDRSMPQVQLTVIKSYGWLTIPSKSLQQVILAAEAIFQCNEAVCLSCSDALQLLLDKSSDLLNAQNIPNCHNVGILVLKKFFRLRLHICAKGLSKTSKDERQFGSKSAKSRTTIK